jgi:hypothetical protein
LCSSSKNTSNINFSKDESANRARVKYVNSNALRNAKWAGGWGAVEVHSLLTASETTIKETNQEKTIQRKNYSKKNKIKQSIEKMSRKFS